MQNLVFKTCISLCKSCRGLLDLQLCYSLLVALWLQKFEKMSVKQSYLEMKMSRERATHDAVMPRPHVGLPYALTLRMTSVRRSEEGRRGNCSPKG
jgi:hypothetical protein